MANNHKDSGFGVDLWPINSIGYTPNRQKQDKSSSYMLIQHKSGGGPFRVWMERAFQNPNINSAVLIKDVGQEAFISQYAYEMYGKVQIRGCIQNKDIHIPIYHVSGVWSPDSV
ncbi:hypothetical protein B9G54_03115 [Alloscardovia macacae]|nr:hypothetical protein B9G54_03115 [Alloscardovia macacae]